MIQYSLLIFFVFQLRSSLSFQAISQRQHISLRNHANCENGLTSLNAGRSLIVVSPSGGVGEVAAVKAASNGNSVKWFVIAPPESYSNTVNIAQESLNQIKMAGGNLEIAGADAASLILPPEDPNSSLSSVSSWTGTADGIICTADGAKDRALPKGNKDQSDVNVEQLVQTWKDAVKVAGKEASKLVNGEKIAIESVSEEITTAAEQEEESNSIGQLVGSLLPFGGDNSLAIPPNVAVALSNGDISKVTILRHAELFGLPESSPNFSPLRRGPLKNAQLCDEYTVRSARVDTKISNLMDKKSRTNRQSLGELAALTATGELPMSSGLDVCLSSQVGSDLNPIEFWESEFKRCITMLSDDGAQIFETAFSSVPDVNRLSSWLATKWAPAVLRTYDIAAIRVGARPVYALQKGEDQVEIIWQELVDMEAINVGKMIVQVSSSGLIATRAGGDPAKGYGYISPKPLAGEEVLLRRLAEAASQAIDKGLAKKPVVAKKKAKKEVPEVAAVSSIQAAGNAIAEAPPSVMDESASPRGGARRSRSRERARGSQRKSAATSSKRRDRSSTPKKEE